MGTSGQLIMADNNSGVSETLFLNHMGTIQKVLDDIQSTVKIQNSRVYKLEEKFALLDQKDVITKDSKARWFGLIGLVIGVGEIIAKFVLH